MALWAGCEGAGWFRAVDEWERDERVMAVRVMEG